MFEEVQKVIDTKIRPKLMKHYGDIKLIGVKDQIVEVKLLGACGSCPSAKITLEEIVLADLQEEIPTIKEVHLVHEMSQDLIDMAKKILNKKR
ncbi:NifU family protein [Inediibacterium massiliense]|uniref:NifU family protein n=1 Tax=Inediibacterium massiliense TaxID=1658111 RepID=UPI0006B66099|nr:NifU family protein [Inediibacterium massiliense]